MISERGILIYVALLLCCCVGALIYARVTGGDDGDF